MEVYAGAVVVSSGRVILRTSPLGSCVAVAAYDPVSGAGGIAHVMLPGAASPGMRYKTRYSRDAVKKLLEKLEKRGLPVKKLKFVIAGGANVMRFEKDTVSGANISSVCSELERRGLRIEFKSVGGFERRVIALDLSKGIVSESLGSGGLRAVYRY